MGAAEAQPSSDPLYHAFVLQKQGHYQASQAACEAIAKSGVEDSAKLFHLEALNLFHLRQIDAALDKLDRALAISPEEPQLYEHLAKILLHLGENALAIESLAVGASRVFGCKPQTYEVLFALRLRLSSDKELDWDRDLGFFKLLISAIKLPNLEVIPNNHLQEISKSLANNSSSEEEITLRMTLLLESLDFKKDSSLLWNERIFTHLILPNLRAALKKRHFNLALKLEATIYNVLVKQKETEAHFTEHFSQWVPDMEAAGSNVGADLEPVKAQKATPVKIAFFVHTLSRLAHVELMMNLLKGVKELDKKPFEASIIAFGGKDTGLLNELDAIGISYFEVEKIFPELQNNHFEKLIKVREYCQAEAITAIVWVSVETLMSFAFSMRLAPVQIWWAMKYHGANIQAMDGAVTGGSLSPFKKINNKLWRTARIGHTNWVSPELAEQALVHRDKFKPYSTLLGSFGREEKLKDPVFLNTVSEILSRNPECAFLWTGRAQLDEIQNVFDKAGVSQQCFYIGWINTRFYAHVIDIFLDSFPFPCGFTALESMALSKPIVFAVSDESSTTGVRGAISPVLEGEEGTQEQQSKVREIFRYDTQDSLYLCANTADEYLNMSERLIQAKDFREQSGRACEATVNYLFSDKKAMAESYSSHFLEIINEHKLKD